MRFKSDKEKQEWNDSRLSTVLKQVVTDASEYARKKWDWEFTVTSIYRTPQEDAVLQGSGVHSLWRAVDVRTKDQKTEAVNDVAEYINKRWIYDPQRPALKVCFKEPHGTAVHAHFQVHANTRLNKKSRTTFRGNALPLDANGISAAAERLGVKAAEIWAVIDVETYGYGFIADRRPLILFERHIFSRETNGKYDVSHPDISHPKWGGYGEGGANQYSRLERALPLDREAALRSASWGIGQVMGFNCQLAGFKDVEEMVEAMLDSENKQLAAMTNFIKSSGLDKPLQAHDWAGFARGYNGSSYAENKYDIRLNAAYNRRRIVLPDLSLRAAQVFLTYLGYHPGKVDGVPGPTTYAALKDFQEANKLPVESKVSKQLLAALKEKASAKTSAK